MAYTKTNWAPGEPITQSRMKNIEDGIEAAHNSLDTAIGAANSATAAAGQATTRANDAYALAESAASVASSSQQGASQGQWAWTQLIGAGVLADAQGNISYSLNNVLGLMNDKIGANTTTIGLLDGQISNAINQASGTNYTENAIDTLAKRLAKINYDIGTVTSAISNINTNLFNANNQAFDVLGRLRALDGAPSDAQQLPSRTVQNIIKELNDTHESSAFIYNGLPTQYNSLDDRLESDETKLSNLLNEIEVAHESTALNKTGNNAYANIDERFEAIESELVGTNAISSRIDTLAGDVSDLSTNKINTSAIANNLTTDTAGKVLDARQGKTLNEAKINYTDIVDDVIHTDVDKPLSANQGKVLKDAIDTINSGLNTAETGLVARVSALETEVDMTSASSRIDSALSRLDAIDDSSTGAIKGINDKIDTIAGELGMTDTNGLKTLGTRVDELEGNIETVATELGMVQSGEIVNTNTRIDTLDATINDANTGLAATKAIADAAATASDLSDLDDRVTALENNPVSSTLVVEQVTYNNDGIPTSISNPSADIDYLLKKDGNYYYWKYINNTWKLISGGSDEGGTSSAEFYSDFPQNASETVDYFIGSGENYVHYRWHNNAWVQILPNHLINSVSVDTSTVSDGITKSKPIIKEIGSETNLLSNFTAIQSISSTQNENGSTTLTWIDIDGGVGGVTITGGGGSGTNVTATITRITDSPITTISGEDCIIQYTYMAMESEESVYETTGQGTWYINGNRVATQQVINGNNSFNIAPYLNIGTNNISLSVTISADGQNITRTKTWVANVVNFSLTWNYNESTVQSDSTINFICTPYGSDITKILHIKVGTYEQTQTVTTSGIPVTVTIPNNYTHGNYTAEMWMTATINGEPQNTPHITHDFIVVESGNNTPIIAATLPSGEINQYDTISIPFVVYTPNSTLSTVTLTANGVVQDVRDEVNRTTQTWNYTPSTLGTDIIYEDDDNDENTPEVPISGTHTLTITSGTTTKTLILTVKSVKINNAEIGGYVFKLKTSEVPSNNALQSWHYDDNNVNNTKLQFSNNFDWINGGIKTELDENGQIRQYIRIKSGTTMSIPYKMFSNTLPDPRINGCNFKIIFKVENCRNYDAVVATNVANNIGIQLNAHNAVFKSTTTQVSTQYGENEYTELEFEVYKNHTANDEEANNPYMMAWIDGVMTSARPYDGNFTQTNASNIIIGSNDCDVCIYLIKYYPTVLSIADHISNFIADAPNASEMIKRFNRNDILYTDSTDIDPNKLAQKNRDCRVWLYDIPRMTTGKKDYVAGVGFQQIYKNGTAYQDGLHGVGTLTVQGTSSVNYRKGAANTDINFYDTKNADRLAVCELYDGEENNLLYDTVNGEQVVKPVNERGYKINTTSTPITYSNMKVNFASCEQVNNMCNAEWYQQFQPYPSLSTRDCMEFAMGVQFIHDQGIGEPTGEVILFNEKGANRDPNKYYMYSIGNLGTSKKNTHIFHSDDECCVEVMNNQNAGCRMITIPADLQADYTAYQNAQYESMTNYDWGGDNESKDHSYEMRFPDTKNPSKEIKAGWARFVKWMAENNPAAATDTAIPQEVYAPYTFKGHKRTGTQVLQGVTVNQYAGTYNTDSFERRMAKMLSECEDYMAMDSVIYHFLFIERHTMVDNVAKNTFWSAAKTNQYINGVEQEDTEGYWIWDLSKNYDNDTSDGNNNEGQLIFDYGNEAMDRQDGKAIFNASDAVWFVFASNLYEACQAMFQNRESATSKNGKWQNAWSASNYHAYLLSEQRKVPERVWNECYWYDYLRTYETGKVYNEETDKDIQIIDKSWITFLDGGQKTHQRQHYETFEELYDASKYRSNFSTANSITLRGYTPDSNDPSLLAVPAKSEISVKMYNKCYLTAHFDNNIETQKAERGQLVTLQFLEPNGQYMNLSDTVIKIDTASMIQEIGDLAPLYPGQASFSAAVRLRSIKIGDSTEGYNNPHITNTETGTVDFGANYMLEHLELQNLSNANQPLNLTGCPALTYLDASGSSFTSIVFANGGLLSEAYVNNPTNLVMRNLDLLTKNNFHLTDPTAVIQLRLEGCKLFDKQSFVEELTNLNIIRLSGINWTLNNNTLLNKLLGIMGMDELGYTVAQSYLAGNIELTGTVYGGDYAEYMKAWSPDLTIDYSHATYYEQFLVTYYDEDNTTVLYTKYITQNNPFVDIVATGEYNEPTKPADVESQYRFGRLEIGEYLPYSGWRYKSASQSFYPEGANAPSIPSITGPTEVSAVYSSTYQQYTVRWLVDNKEIARANSINYGGGQTLSAPTIKEVQAAQASTCTFINHGDGTCSYRIMTGWEKLPTNITPTVVNAPYDINATWLERPRTNYNTILTSNDYSVEEKLLVLKNIENARNNLAIQDTFPITLGYNGIKPAIELLASPKRYTGIADAAIDAYTPFAANKSFTIAIDYRFERVINDNVNEAVLMSCYAEDGDSPQGFKLFYNPKSTVSTPVPQISFGDTASQINIDQRVYTIGSTINNRGMVVLRHIAGQPELYVYSGSTASGQINSYSANIFRKTLNGSANASNAKIILGGINSEGAINARGTLYSVRYWEEDLGDGECTQLANWCHETMNFAVQDFTEADLHSALDNSSTVKLVLHTLNASAMGTIEDALINKNTETTVGWDPSNIRTFYNERLYRALPILLQSIIVPTDIKHVKANKGEGNYVLSNSSSITKDYVFASSYREVGGESNTNDTYNTNYNAESVGPFVWSGLTIMKYSNGQFIQQNDNSIFYTNLRFPYRAITINFNTKVFVDYPTSGTSFETYANTHSLELNTGDILIPNDGTGATTAYIYINNTDVRNGAPFVANGESYLSTSTGAWIESTSWWTRSIAFNNITGTNNSRFTHVTQVGTPRAGNYRYNGIVYSIAL